MPVDEPLSALLLSELSVLLELSELSELLSESPELLSESPEVELLSLETTEELDELLSLLPPQ